jgi:hypothetical protein
MQGVWWYWDNLGMTKIIGDITGRHKSRQKKSCFHYFRSNPQQSSATKAQSRILPVPSLVHDSEVGQGQGVPGEKLLVPGEVEAASMVRAEGTTKAKGKSR